MSVSDSHVLLTRGRRGLLNFDVTVTYRAGFKNQVPDALSRCALEDREDGEVESYIPIVEASALGVTRAQAASRGTTKRIP